MSTGTSPLVSLLGPHTSEEDAKAIQLIEEVTNNAKSVQEKMLIEILNQNAETEYLQRFKLNGATDRETFISKVPLITYKDIQAEIHRIANGDRSAILTSRPFTEFFYSSGTTSGKKNFIPMTQEEFDRRQVLTRLLTPVLKLYMPGLDKGKGLYFMFSWSDAKTQGGLPTGTVVTKFYKSEHFKNQRSDPYTAITSPTEAILCTDWFQSMYTQMLCGLYEHKQVNRFGTAFASGLLRAIRFLQLNWVQLTHDIRTGKLNPQISDPSIRECITRILKPSPETAEFISKECSKDNWEGIITRIWPNIKFLDVIITGAKNQYIPMIDFYSGGLPIISNMYASSECCFGINLNLLCKPSEVSYTILPNLAYFEFIPHEPDSLGSSCDLPPKPVQLVDVELGKEYELVITTYAGLYRYQVGDILRVSGFYNSAPQVQIVKRKNVLLSVDADKTDEVELQKAVESASQLLREFNTSVAEYTTRTCTEEIPGHYVIYWELLAKDSAKWPSDEVLCQCCLAMEDSLSSIYRTLRASNVIRPLEIRVVKSGTFEALLDHAISRGISISQYKAPKCVTFPPIIELLDSRVFSAHFSPSLPNQATEEMHL